MKNLLTPLCAVALVCPALAQTGKISGQLLDENAQPAAFVTVMLMTPDSTMAKGGITDTEGQFAFVGIAPGTYRVESSSVEFEKFSTDLFEYDGKSLSLPAVQLRTMTKELAEVTVTATRPMIEVQPDKTVFNVTSSPNATGTDGMELLRRSPGVTVDNNDNIILQGKNGVIVYIDDKPVQLSGQDLVAMLRGMQSDQIESIEIITNPSSKYDAQGNAGIINIRLKRDKNLGTNAQFNTGYSVGRRERYRGGVTANHREKNFSVTGNYNYYNNESWNSQDIYREQLDAFYDTEGEQNWNVKGHGFRAGGDYYLTDKHTVGMVVNGFVNNNNSRNYSFTPIGPLATGTPDSVLVANNRDARDITQLNYNLNYMYKGAKGATVNLDLDYGTFNSSDETLQPNEYRTPDTGELMSGRYFTNYRDTEIDIYTAKVDYEVTLGEGRLSMGAKVSNVLTDNAFEQYNETSGTPILEERSSLFEYTERVSAAYVSYAVKLAEKWNLTSGLRMESTFSEGDLTTLTGTDDQLVTRRYTDFFPSGGLTYAISEKHQLGVNYSRRINRPSYQDLNPFEYQLDELTYQKGNPFLNPQYTDSYQLTHTYNSFLSTRVGYSHTSNFFSQVIEPSDENERATVLRQQNLATSRNYSLNISAPVNILKWWSTYSSLTVNRTEFESALKFDQLSIGITTVNVFIQNNFMLPKKFKLEVSGWYNSPQLWAGTLRTSSLYSIDIGVQKAVFKDRGNINVGISDIFRTQQWTGGTNFNDVRLRIGGAWDSHRLNVGFTYRLGNDNVKMRRRSTGLEDESSRIKSN